MTPAAILALITALLAAAPTLTADAEAAVKAILALFQNNSTATTAQVQAAIVAALAQAKAADAAVEQG